MDASSASWLVIVIALVAANLPFFNDKVFALVRLSGRKPLALRLGEMLVLYFAVGAAGLALEARIGGVFPQGWEFYAITACLFLVLAFPGFALRYLRKSHA